MLWQWYPWKIHEIHHGVLVMTVTFPWSPKKGSKLPAHRWGPHHEVWKSLIQARCAGHPSGPYPTSGTRPTRWGCWTFWGSFFFLFLSKCICICLPLHIFNIEIYGGYYVFIFLFTDYVHIHSWIDAYQRWHGNIHLEGIVFLFLGATFRPDTSPEICTSQWT